MREIKIDFDNPGLPQRLDVVENDAQSRFFKAVLYKDGKAYAAPSGATYSIMYRGFGPQNEGWYDTINDGAGKRAACSVSGNVVTCEIARQALRVPGHVSVVLCVTGSNGYMLHGWPIDCNCRNDSYTGGTSVESFFYITQVTNADWTSAIQTWEELKNMIDPTLSLSGKAADAKATGDAVGEIKEDIDERLYYTTNYKQPEWSEGFIRTSGTIVDISKAETGHPMNKWRHSVIDCKEHDVIIVKAKGGTEGRLWAFIGAENQILSVSEAEKNSMDTPVYLYAPHNSTKIIINDWSRNIYPDGVQYYPENAAKVYCYQVPDERDFYGVFNSLKSAIDINEIKICNINTADKDFKYEHFVVWDNGGLSVNLDFCSTGYIDISGYKEIGLSNGLQQFSYYDKNKTYISGVPVESSLRGYVTYNIPNNAKYVRFSVLQSLVYTAFYALIHPEDRESKEIIVSKYGYGNFTRLRDGVEYATKYQNSIVKVLDGVYDLLEEFSEEINRNLNYQYGIELKNNVHIICSSGAKITAIYNGTSQNVENYFSPFFPAINNGNFVLENVWIETKNTRYCVHDELGGGGGTQTHKYINCHMEHDSLNSLTDNFPQCIGGGLGKYTYIVIDGGYYKRTATTKSYTRPTISYHNNFTDDGNGVSHVYVKNIYVDTADGTVTIQNYGNNTRKSILEISGCSLGIAPFNRNETEDSTIVNTEVVSFNNEIRQ